jgi:uncharacterized membrane protein YpjA
METIIIVIITVSVIAIVFGFVYYLWCNKQVPLHATEFSFDDIYQYQEARI